MPFRLRRSVLYVPGANGRAIEKARGLAADAVILDLEDAVAPDQKHDARALVKQALAAGGFGGREVVVRINALSSPWGSEDLAMVVAARPDAILVPKISSAADLAAVRSCAGDLPLWAMIETPLAILNLTSIGEAGKDNTLTCLVLGTNDLTKDSGMSLADGRFALVPTLAQAVLTARAYGLSCLDGVFNDISDAAGFAAECKQGRALGMNGKTLIHPSQIEPCNRAFSPSADEIAWARGVTQVFARPETVERSVATLDGRMVERLHLEMAQRILTMAEAIG